EDGVDLRANPRNLRAAEDALQHGVPIGLQLSRLGGRLPKVHAEVLRDPPDHPTNLAMSTPISPNRQGGCHALSGAEDGRDRSQRRWPAAPISDAGHRVRGRAGPKRWISTGSTSRAARREAVAPTVSKRPSVKMPRWWATIRLPKPATVVRPL